MLYEENNNIKWEDTFGLQKINVNRNVIYNGDCGIFNKTNYEKEGLRQRPLAAAVLGINNTDIPLPDDLEFHNIWTDMDAQEAYLKEKPKTYVILGKNGSGSYNLGEALSKKINCIHICPKNVLIDEIEQKSSTGKCLDFNMRHNNVCKFDIIMSIIKEKLKSPVISHRGFIISGIPLVLSSKNDLNFFSSLYTEESIMIVESILFHLVYNFKKKKFKIDKSLSHSSMSIEHEMSAEEEEEKNEEQEIDIEDNADQIAELPKFLLEPCSNLVFHTDPYYETTKILHLRQMKELFGLNPDIIIFITCPSTDVVTKKSHKYINYPNNSSTFVQFPTNIENGSRWPANYYLTDFKSPYDSHIFNPKYYCKQPINFKDKAIDQLCNYSHTIRPFIELKLNDFVPNAVIKVDGRTSTHQMIYITMEKILLMTIKTVIIPEPLYLEDPPSDFDEFWNLVEELNVIRSGVVKFNRYASLWYNRCPVELKKRKSVQGKPKFAVTFFKHVYLLSSLDAMVKFCRNPRPFLKLVYLEPTCRIIIIGTKSSGKTMIAECLSWLFDTPIISFSTFLEKEKQKKYNEYAKSIFFEIVSSIEDSRISKWQSLEIDRISKLNTWFNTQSSILNAYVPLLRKKLMYSDGEYPEEHQSYLNKFHNLRKQLSFLPIDDLNECEYLLKDNNLIKFAPVDLTAEIIKPSVPTLGDEDVTEAILAYIKSNELEKEIEPTPEEVMAEITTILRNTDSESLNRSGPDQNYGKFIIDGFSSNPEYWKYLTENNLLPDYTIAVLENREVDFDLFQHYLTIEKCIKNYQERYLLSNDNMVKIKLLQHKPPDTTKTDVQIMLGKFLDEVFEILPTVETDTDVQNDNNLLTSFTESIEKFREDWETLKQNIEENSKTYVEVELENKSDIEIINEVLLKLRKGYLKTPLNVDDIDENQDDENESVKGYLIHNDSNYFGETNIYCPIAFYDHGVLWKGKSEFSTKYDNKIYYTSNEECNQKLQYDITKYQSYNKPFKNIPPLRICVIGGIGSGKSTISKIIAKELGLLHIDFSNFINEFLIPKHFKKCGWQYENSFTDANIEEEDVVEFQMDEENVNIFDILSNEKELRRLIYNYLERGSPLPSILNQSMLKKLWFEYPYVNTGIVIDGLPKMTSDVEDMTVCFCIPDLVIFLESNSEITLERLSSKLLNKWKTQLIEAKTKAFLKLEAERRHWKNFITRTAVVQLIIDEILDEIIPDIEIPLKSSSIQSTIIDADPTGSSNVDVKLFTVYNKLIEEYPEPTDQNEWENADDALEKINNRLESIFDIDDENIQTVMDVLEEQKIKTVRLDAKKTINKVTRNTIYNLSDLRKRCESFLEQTFIINCDIAEMLLLEGFFLVSKFHRMCPVFILENPFTLINSYNLNRRRNKIFPVIHRSFIYFISSEKNVEKFRKNPLKYIQDDTIKFFQGYPLRIGIIGPPKSGKSKLAAKLAREYGLMCISKGVAIRHIMENMNWTMLGENILSQLRVGKCIDNELIIKAVATVAIDSRIMTNGFVLDGFPESPYEICELSKVGLFPLVIFDLNTNKDIILKNSQREIYYNIFKRVPTYSGSFIKYKYNKWYEKSSNVRDWINQDTQNVYTINGNNSQWQCHADAITTIKSIIPKIHYYLTHVKLGVVRADFMCISNEIFQQRMSCFKNLCPVCLSRNILRHSGYPVDKNGIVQYKGLFFWICSEHLNIVLKSPEIFLSATTINIPEIPAPVKNVNTSIVYENGTCIVTYAENLPAQIVIKGNKKYAAVYRTKTYLFCTPQCHKKFLAKPHLYYNIKVFKETTIFPELELKNIPHLGFLEQSLGNIVTEACCAVNVNRPKYPGLDQRHSAILYIALYLKTHNKLLDKATLSTYTKVLKTFEARCKLVRDISLQLRSIDNPFAMYPNCCRKLGNHSQADSNTVRKPSTNITTNTSLFLGSQNSLLPN